MSKVHNKRRNSGLLYEFLVQTISRALIEGDTKKSSIALKILKKHYRQGTELYKEFRLINSLVRTTVNSEAIAASILHEAKVASRTHNAGELDRQKSLLIKNINHALRDETFYDQQVNEYKTYATIQTLLNDWRATEPDLRRMAQYEDQMLALLVAKKAPPVENRLVEESPGTCRLLMKFMMQKLNEKYSGTLNADQKQLIRAYAFAAVNSDPDVIKKKLIEVRDDLISMIDEHKSSIENEYVSVKLDDVRGQLITESIETVDDDTVVRFMLYTKLMSELRGGKDE